MMSFVTVIRRLETIGPGLLFGILGPKVIREKVAILDCCD